MYNTGVRSFKISCDVYISRLRLAFALGFALCVLAFASKCKHRTRLKWSTLPPCCTMYYFVRCIPKFSQFGVVLRAESWFSRTSAVKFEVCEKLRQTWNFTALVWENQLSAPKTTPTRLTFVVRRTKNIFSVWFHLILYFLKYNGFMAKMYEILKIDLFNRYNFFRKYFFPRSIFIDIKWKNRIDF